MRDEAASRVHNRDVVGNLQLHGLALAGGDGATGVVQTERDRCSRHVYSSLSAKLAQVVTEPILDIPRLLEALLEQCLEVALRRRANDGFDARVPALRDLHIPRQGGID